ncbi:ABC transporter, (TAP family), putative [Plasmodium sp. gorilla clade G2]|uniref:ABC transporter, (TAP family), putative n=1 Tax=Plasmodium sp. gorilla clade G2 TaxID=880535 RepID=UPI000D221CC0|nr:ABC transporter, (TAP family), putative [Plasmodium sp. gorilla clade G2]SOV16622.1 ABC transporter, (TAP family), putative [Plasmodium sp. gorilla clade G2]
MIIKRHLINYYYIINNNNNGSFLFGKNVRNVSNYKNHGNALFYNNVGLNNIHTYKKYSVSGGRDFFFLNHKSGRMTCYYKSMGIYKNINNKDGDNNSNIKYSIMRKRGKNIFNNMMNNYANKRCFRSYLFHADKKSIIDNIKDKFNEVFAKRIGGNNTTNNNNNNSNSNNSSNNNDNNKSNSNNVSSLKDLFNILKKERKYLGFAMFCLIISSLGQMVFPMCISRIINMYGGKEESLKYLTNEIYKTVLLILGISTFSFFRIYFIETSIEKITRRLRTHFFEKVLNQDVDFFNKQKTGELINRLSNDIEISSKFLIHLSFGIRNFISALIGGICALHISPRNLFQSFLLPVSGCLLIGTSYAKFVKKISVLKQEKLSSCIDFASEKIHNISNVRLLNGESYEKKEFINYLEDVYKIGKKHSLVKSGNHFLFFSIISLFLLHLIYYGNYLIAHKFINTGDLFSLIMYSLFCGSGIQGMMHAIGDIQKCLGSCSKVLQIINLPDNKFQNYWNKTSIDFLKGNNFSITFDNVSFSYDNIKENINKNVNDNINKNVNDNINKNVNDNINKNVNDNINKNVNDNINNNCNKKFALKNVSFFLPHNKSVAIVGKSGSGKTTILNLLTKKNDLNGSGKICVGNIPINKINSAVLRSIVGVITQDPFLFNLTVRENLMYPYKAYEQMLKDQIRLIEENQGGIIKNIMNNENIKKEMNNGDNTINNKYDHEEYINKNDTKYTYEIYTFLLKELQKIQEEIKNNLSSDKMKNVYNDLHIDEFLKNHFNYDNMNVGVNGTSLSGGQKQRIYLAQNLIKNNKILILDEPTSSLDKLSENIINKALIKYMKDKTTIIFTHRLDLLNYVDYIGVIEQGQIIQFDKRENVLQKPCPILKNILTQGVSE